MAAKTISAKIKKGANALKVDAEGLFVTEPLRDGGVCDLEGHGIGGKGWGSPLHKSGSGYWLYPVPNLEEEKYAVLVSLRADPAIPPMNLTNEQLLPATIYVHTLRGDYFHITVAKHDIVKGSRADEYRLVSEQIDHRFTWLVLVPEE